MKSNILNVSFILFAFVAASAHAETAARQVVVSYADLDLTNESGAGVMLDRIHAAANRACGGHPDIRLIDRTLAYRSCAQHAVDEAVGQLGSRMVSAMHEGRHSRIASNN